MRDVIFRHVGQGQIVIAALLWTLAVCAAPAQAGAQTVINVVGHWSGWQLTEFEKNAARYMELNPDIKIEFIHAPMDREEGVAKLLVLLGSEETRPDIVHAYNAITPELLAGGIFAPMPRDIAEQVEDFFIPQLLPSLSYRGKLYGIPTENQTYVLGYNDRLFAESGIGEQPSTWDELREYAQRLTVLAPDGAVQRYGFAMDSTASFIQFAHELFTLIWSNGGEYVDREGQVYLDSPAAVETVEFIAGMVKSGIAAVGTSGNPLTGPSAMSFVPTWWRQGLTTSASADYENLRTVVMPANRGDQTAYQYGWGLYVTQESQHADEAWKFLRWLTMETNEMGRTRMGEHMAQLGSLPTNLTDLQAHAEFHEDQFYAGFLESLNVARSEPPLPQMSRRQQTVAEVLTPVFQGTTPARAALEELHRRIELILREAAEQQPQSDMIREQPG